ncbi:MAG: DUF192 domain-containing protein [Patescibacteria group bacterium]
MSKKRTIIFITIMAVGIALCAGLFFLTSYNNSKKLQLETLTANINLPDASFVGTALQVNDIRIPIEIADSDPERIKGLSGRESLPEDTGLLFVFEHPERHGFWMKDMKFSIDMLWLDENLQVITIADSVSPETFPQSFSPSAPAKYVLELNAGFSKEHNIIVGSQFSVIK